MMTVIIVVNAFPEAVMGKHDGKVAVVTAARRASSRDGGAAR